jgi:hypothetical protein
MSVAEKASALLEGISKRDLLSMPAEQRRRFAAALRRIADLADPPAFKAPPRSGVLMDLFRGERAQ